MGTTFVKYCKKEHNIMLGCPTIQLGTLQYYRDLDPNFSKIADPKEATAGYSLKPGEYKLNKDHARNISGGIMQVPDGSHVVVTVPTDGHNLLTKRFSNCYVFCVVRHEDGEKPSLEQAKNFDKDYDSWYTIIDFEGFKNRLLQLLKTRLAFNDFAEDATKQIQSLTIQEFASGYKIITADHEIQYVGSKVHKLGEDDLDSVPKPKSINLDWIFVKDEKYKDDRERRIAFITCYFKANTVPDVLPVKKEPLLLPTNIFAETCEAN